MRYARGFGLFWWDLLVADTPELTAGALIIVLTAYLVSRGDSALTLLLPLMAVALLAASLARAVRSR